MEVRMPGRAGAVRLPTRDEADGEFPLAGQRADRGGHSARGNASDLTEQAAPIQTIRAQSLQDGEHHLSVRYGRQQRGYGLEPDLFGAIMVLRATATVFAFTDAMWEKYPQLGTQLRTMDPTTGEPFADNPFLRAGRDAEQVARVRTESVTNQIGNARQVAPGIAAVGERLHVRRWWMTHDPMIRRLPSGLFRAV